MKKTKYFLVSIMAIVLCLMCLMTTTFSWFTRPSDSGGTLEWLNSESGLSYDAVDGKDISMVTYELSEDGTSAAQTSVTSFSNSIGIEKGHRKYYRTDITNSGDYDQSVSLYIEGLNVTQGNLHLGVNSPLKTYKGVNVSTSTFTMATNDEMRVYLDRNGVLDGAQTYNVAYKVKNSNDYTYEHLWYDTDYVKYHQDIPIDTERFFFAIDQWTGNNRSIDINVNDQNVALTPLQPKLFTLKSGSGYCEYEVSSLENGANLVQYYDTISMSKGAKFTLDLQKGTHYTGKSIEYSVASGSSYISISNDVITAKAVGTAKINIKVNGPYGDSITKQATVTVSDSSSNSNSDTPIVTNYNIPQAVDANTPSTVSVYWYINNEGTEALKYEIADVYLSL